jgi:hypothetical protein
MATVINNPGNREEGDSGAGWAVAVVILLIVIGVGAYLWTNYNSTSPAVPSGTDNSGTSGTGDNTLNVTLPGVTGSASTSSTTP